MRRRGLAAAMVVALVFASARPAAAVDPAVLAIAQWLSTQMNPGLRELDALQIAINNRQRWYMWVRRCTDAMRVIRTHVYGIRRELTEISCSFRFSPRVEILRGMLLRPSRFCAPSWDAVWGTTSDLPWDDDRQRLADRQGALVHNLLSSRSENEHGSWDRVFWEQLQETATTRKSVGDAERDAAINVAWLAAVTADNKRLDDQALLLEELRWSARRSRLRSERLQGLAMWESMAAQGPTSGDPLALLDVEGRP